VAGDSIIQLIPETVSSLIKIIRTTHFDSGIRAIAFDSLKKTFIKHDSIKDESVGKDLVKVVKYGLADKSNIIQLRASQVYSSPNKHADFTVIATNCAIVPFHHISDGFGELQGTSHSNYGYTVQESSSRGCSKLSFDPFVSKGGYEAELYVKRCRRTRTKEKERKPDLKVRR